MMRIFGFLIVVFFLSGPVVAQDSVLTVDLADDSIGITTGFDGSHLSLFGEKNKGGQVAVVIRGPKKDVLVRKKHRVIGAWMNRESLRFEDVPEYYDFALSDDEDSILDAQARKEAGIGFEALKFMPEKDDVPAEKVKEFQQAFVRNMQAQRLFPVAAKDIVFLSDTFFKTQFYVPSNVPTGQYVIETFLIDDGKVLDKKTTQVKVAQVGFSSGVYRFANSYSFAYAMLIVLLAVVAGWLSNVVRQNNK